MSEGSWQICPVLGVRDVRAAVDYLAEHLGFEVLNIVDGVDEDDGAIYGIVQRGGAELHVQIRRRPLRGGERESIEGDVCVRVADVDALHRDLVGRGATIFRGLVDEPYGMRDFTAEGPEGYRLTFGAPVV